MKRIFIFISIITAGFFITGCGNKKTAEEPEQHEHAEGEASNTATLTAEQMKSIRLELGHIEKKQLTASLKANGILKVPNQNKATATALIGGVVRSISIQTGNVVRKGQVIATIANTSFITMQEEYIGISSRAELAEQENKRQKELQAGNAGTLKNLQQSEAELRTLKARKASLRKQLELVGIDAATLTSENIQPVVSIISPISGTVSNVQVNIGSYVDANKPVAEIIDNSQLHLDLFVYEKDLEKIKEGQTIHFTLTNNPGKEYDAKIFGIGNTFESNTKAIAIHATVEGDKSGLIDGMSITALVSLEHATVDAVPTEAIVNYQGNDFVFVIKTGNKEEPHNHNGHEHKHEEATHVPDSSVLFERIPVRKGTTDIGYSEVTLLKEIPEHAQIVTKGAFFILAKMTNSGEHEH
jgi:membrane fusion protein, heavy metal efflux system